MAKKQKRPFGPTETRSDGSATAEKGSPGQCPRSGGVLWTYLMCYWQRNIRRTKFTGAHVDTSACEDTTLCWSRFQVESWTHPPPPPSQICRITHPTWTISLPLVDGALLSALATKATSRTSQKVSLRTICSTGPPFLLPVSCIVC